MDSHPLLQIWSQALRSRHPLRATASPMTPPWWCWELASAPGTRCPCQAAAARASAVLKLFEQMLCHMALAQSCISATTCCLPHTPPQLSAPHGASLQPKDVVQSGLPPVQQAHQLGQRFACHAESSMHTCRTARRPGLGLTRIRSSTLTDKQIKLQDSAAPANLLCRAC